MHVKGRIHKLLATRRFGRRIATTGKSMTKTAQSVTYLLFISLGWSAAQGQATSSAPDATTPSQGLEEIVVTAQRREESLQHAALAVTAISGEQLAQAGAISVEDLTQLVPALQVAPAAGPYPLFYLRGVGNFNGNALSDSALAINLDGVYVARPSSSNGMFYDVNRLEVLKGPQGTLYGRNATGGAINVITNKPTDEFGGEFTADFGNYDAKNFDGYINMPFSSVIKTRLSVQSTEHAGYMSDGTDDDYGRAARLQVLVTPNDELSINTSGDFYHQGGKGVGATLLQAGVPGWVGNNPWNGNTGAAISTIYSRTFYFPAGDVLGPLLTKTLFAQSPANIQQDNDFWGVSSTLDWKTDLGTLTVIPAYRHSKLDFTNTAAGFLIEQEEHDQQSSFEARFASNANQAFTYLAGVFYLNEKIDVENATYDQQYNASQQEYDPSTKSYAVFGRLGYAITESFRVNAGLRFTDDQKSFDGVLKSASVICPGAFIPPPAGPQFCFGGAGQITVPGAPIVENASDSWRQTTWRAGVEYDLTNASLLYAAVETGFKAGGFFFTDDNPTYQPEKITAYTVGSKNRFLDNKLQVNGELYYWIYKDQQISHLGIDSAGTVIFPTDNVGQAKMKGFELEGQYLLTPTTLFTMDAQYLDAIYDTYVYPYPNLGAPPSTSCPFSLVGGGANYSVNCSGNTPPQAPRWSADFGLRQTVPVGLGSIVGTATAHFQTETLTGLEFSSLEEQPSYWIANATLGYQAPKDRWNVTGYVNNLADRTVIAGTFPNPLAGATLTAATLRPPRTYGIRLGVKF
jgi:iron complex outermembrane receptor protein